MAGLKRGSARRILDQTVEVVSTWPAIAKQVEVDKALRKQATKSHRLRWD